MTRFLHKMTTQDKVTTLADGKMGALPVCFLLSNLSPDYLDVLDKLNIYGDDIYLIWNDVCQRDIGTMGMMLVAALAQTFGVTRDKLVEAAHSRGAGIDVALVMTRMRSLESQVNPALLNDPGLDAMSRRWFENEPPR